VVQDCDALPVTCYTPQAFRTAYGISPLVRRGIDGRGRTVTILDGAVQAGTEDSNNIYEDLAAYDSHFGLPKVHLQVVTRFIPSASPSLAIGEEVEDVEVVHAVAPAASIRVVLMGPGLLFSDLGPVLRYAIPGTDVISPGFGEPEHCLSSSQLATLKTVLEEAASRHVTVVASSGDTGPVDLPGCSPRSVANSVRETDFPASGPLVLGVGGTQLRADPRTGAYIGETVWDDAEYGEASGGGFSEVFARPGYQDGVPGIGPHRGVPDVAADADIDGGLALLSYTGDFATIRPAGGTSAGAPFWAGVIAIADQYAGRDLGFVNPAIYRIARSAQYHAAFHDITKGTTTVDVPDQVTGYRAGPGWDPATGWGTPKVSALVPLLARYARTAGG
jgi:subtilase family serine protease